MKRWGLAGAVVVVLVGVALAGWWVLTPHQDRSVAMPADDAAPERVVEVYVDALDAGDCDTALALHDPASRDSSWCDTSSPSPS
ncbi:hypothetical protein [Nocardioides daphniae]|uniref:Uncharacterized protein n=1 Tax=Nocardioides daphniae TaxID=402297 RepID=A0A4P7UCE1_9ACTN|nr:hypothetical protein [Nocardioides daphniae]QCC76649.1 hypothetical protein E2C04_04460 [Nocardioides daphniae]